MLIIKEPIKLNCKEPIHTVNEGFCHRITGNYNLMTGNIGEEDLLHLVTSPPEVYLAESEGTQIMNQSIIFNQKEMKIEMINNLLNRLSMSQEVHLNYQDKIYIDNVLRKLGIKNTSQFIEQVNKQKIRNQTQEEIIHAYWNFMESYNSREDSMMEVRNMLNMRLEEQKEEYRNYLHESVLNRLNTGVIYRIIENFNRAASYNSQWMEQNKIQFAEQKKISHQILINQLENFISDKQVPFVYLEKNEYEVLDGIEEAGKESVNQQITRAVLFQLLNNIHMERLTGYKKEEQLWMNFRNSLYQSAENTIYRIKNQVQQVVENHIRENNNEIMQRDFKGKPVRESETLLHRELIKEGSDLEEISQNQYHENHYDIKEEEIISHSPVEIEHKMTESSQIEKVSEYLRIENDGKESTKQIIRDETKYQQKKEKEGTDLIHPKHQEDGFPKEEAKAPEIKEVAATPEILQEREIKLIQQLSAMQEKSIENWEINNHLSENQEKYSENRFLNILENQSNDQNEFYEFENINLQYKAEKQAAPEIQAGGESGRNTEISQNEHTGKEAEKQLYKKLEEINRKNVESLEIYKNILEERNKITTATVKTMEEKRTETLKALQAPEELLLEYKKEAGIQNERQDEARKKFMENLPEETRKVFQLIEAYQKSDGTHDVKGISMNDFSTLHQDTNITLNHLEHISETEKDVTIYERENTSEVVERWKHHQQNEPSPKEVHNRTREVSMVHKQINQSIEEEALQQILEENRAFVQKETRNEIVHKDRVQVTTVENREEKRILQNNMKDITEMIDQGVKRQIGMISDQVYHRLEKKLSNEKKRRGF